MGCEFEETALRANRAYNVIPTTAKARDHGGAPPRNEWSPLDQFALIPTVSPEWMAIVVIRSAK